MSDSSEISQNESISSNSEDYNIEYSANSSDSSADSSTNEVSNAGYEYEPEFTEEEMKSISEQGHESSSSEDNSDLDSSRLENLHWCKCRNCVIGLTFTVVECKCCQECTILDEKLQDIKCITQHKDFENLMLNPSVLELSFIRHRRYQNIYKTVTKMSNRQVLSYFLLFSNHILWLVQIRYGTVQIVKVICI